MKFLRSLLSSESNDSSKRFVTLIVAGIFIITNLVSLFFVFYLILYTPRGAVNIDLLNFLKDIMYYDFLIVLSGLGFITAENLSQVILERAKAVIAGNIAANSSNPATVKVDDVKVEKSPEAEAPLEPEPPQNG